MSSREHAERLAQALASLKYVEPISFEGSDFGTIKALCRIKSTHLAEWAKVVTGILTKAEALRGTDAVWDSHICRLYMLKDGKLAYGWLVAITSRYMDDCLAELVPTIKSYVLAPPAPVMVVRAPAKELPPVQVVRSARGIKAPPDADARGNPRVHPSHRVTKIQMAGLHPQLDRNAPSEDSLGKGTYGMFSSKRLGSVFKPPIR
jgi:hypothetical protein